MDSQTRPGFFCSRPNGTLTPLIAVDELPTQVSIRGVPRTLTAKDTQGMTSCGVAPLRNEPWVVDDSASMTGNTNNNQNDPTELCNMLFKVLRDENVSSATRTLIHGVLYRHMGGHVSAQVGPNAGAGQALVPTHNANNGNFKSGPAHNGKKEYCSYWIRHGECDYQQQGCLFKHEMPTDPELLERLGLREIPRWYREKYGVPGVSQPNFGNTPSQTAAIEHPMRTIEYNATRAHSENNSNGTNYPRGSNNHYKSPRGMAAGRGGRLGGWHKVVHARFQAVQNGGPKHGRSSSLTEDAFPVANKFDTLRDVTIDGREHEEGGVRLPKEHLLDQNGMAHGFDMRLAIGIEDLTNEDPIDKAAMKGLEKQVFRTKSRRLFERDMNGKDQIKATAPAGVVTNNNVTTNKVAPKNVAFSTFPHPHGVHIFPQGTRMQAQPMMAKPSPMMADLLKNSDPIFDPSRHWDRIGESGIRRASTESEQSGQSSNSDWYNLALGR